MEIFLHKPGQAIQLIQIEKSASVSELADEHADAGASVWLEDGDQTLDGTSTLADAGIEARCHVHVSTCRAIAVKVRHGGRELEHAFPPAVTVARVFAWAAGPQGFGLTPDERPKHVLIVCGTAMELDRSEHIGSIAGDDCSVCLDLVPKERFEG